MLEANMLISSSIIEDLECMRRSGSALEPYFYFDFKDSDKQNRRTLLSSLLVQLCTWSDPFHDILSRLYLSHDRGPRQSGNDSLMGNDKQHTPLALASFLRYLIITLFLIEKGAAVSAPDKEGDTPFYNAAYQGHLHVTKFLLERGIDVDIRNGNRHKSLYSASGNGKLDVVCFPINQAADIHIRHNNNSNPLQFVSLNGYLDVVQLLTSTGIPVDVWDGTQKTLLTLAPCNGKVDIVRFLIHRRADYNQCEAPLHLASQHGHIDMAQLLLDHGVDPNINCNGLWTPLHLASADGHLKIAEFPVQRGSSHQEKTPVLTRYKFSIDTDGLNRRLITEIRKTMEDNGRQLSKSKLGLDHLVDHIIIIAAVSHV